MLSSNSIVQNGRYRIIQRIGTIGPSIVYDAFDNLRSANVILGETPLATSRVLTIAEREAQSQKFEQNFTLANHVTSTRFIRHASQFVEVDRHYVVTEPVGELSSPARFGKRIGNDLQVASEIDAWLQMAAEIRVNFPMISNLEITPVSVRVDETCKARLLFLGNSDLSAGSSNLNTAEEADLAFVPLERIWPQLDSASRKAISHSYNDYSLELLESPCDVTADIYSIVAIIFRLATGQAPPNALERSIELLDGGPDPLIAAIERAGHSTELSNFFVRALQIRREERFASIADARLELSRVKPSSAVPSAADDFDLLELPPVPTVPQPRTLPQTARVSMTPPSEQTQKPVFKAPSVETLVERASTQSVIAFEKREYLATLPDILDEPIIHDTPARPIQREAPPTAIEPMFDVAPARSYSLIIAAVVTFIVIGAGAFAIVSLRQGPAVDTVPQAAIMPEAKLEPVTTSPPAVISEQSPIPESVPSAELPLQPDRNQRPAIADAKQPKKASEKSDVKSDVKRKKAVTVDDLISDN